MTDYFLNVMMVTDKKSKDIPMVKVVSESANEITIEIKTQNGISALATFSKGDKSAAHLRMMNGSELLVNEDMPNEVLNEYAR